MAKKKLTKEEQIKCDKILTKIKELEPEYISLLEEEFKFRLIDKIKSDKAFEKFKKVDSKIQKLASKWELITEEIYVIDISCNSN